VRESLAQGLPIIPFNYPTFVIVERQREHKRLLGGRTAESVSQPPVSRKISEVTPAASSEQAGQERSLNKLLVEAKKQLEIEKEAMKRKVNTARMIRGYAANNSRALGRRRSSVTDYVSLGRLEDSQETQDTFSQNLQAMDEDEGEKEEVCLPRPLPDLCDDYLDMNYGCKH